MSENTNTPAVVEKKKKDISAQVLAKVNAFKDSGELRIPENYSPENALKSAYLVLAETKNKDGHFALTHCTEESIANALLKMVVWGLSPLKKQCYFIMYGTKLQCDPDYSGNILLAKRFGGLKDIKLNAIFEGDTFEFEVNTETGKRRIIKHVQTLDTIGSNSVKGAYAVLEMNDGSRDVEIMSISQIKASWEQGATNGTSPAHKKFADEMAKKTVSNRACKLLIRASDDKPLYTQNIEEETTIDVVAEDVSHELSENANKESLDFTDSDEPKATTSVNEIEVATTDSELNKPQF